MTSIKIVKFLTPPTLLLVYVQTSSIPLTLDIQFQMNPPPPLQIIAISVYSSIQKQPSGGVLRKRCSEICSKFIAEHPCNSNFVEIALWHGCSVNLLHIFRTPFPKNTSGQLLLSIQLFILGLFIIIKG